VSIEEGDAKARELNVNFIETSAKAGLNIKVWPAWCHRMGNVGPSERFVHVSHLEPGAPSNDAGWPPRSRLMHLFTAV
jgi:hypothetical protein